MSYEEVIVRRSKRIAHSESIPVNSKPKTSKRAKKPLSKAVSELEDESTPGNGWTNQDVPPTMYPHLSQDGQVHLYQVERRYIHTAHGWSRTGSSCPNDAISTAGHGGKVNHKDEAKVVKSLISQMCEKFYEKGWMPGTGGGLSIRIGNGTDDDPFRVFSTPSGIQKEDMIGDDLFELDMDQKVTVIPKTPGLKLSSMTNIWYCVYDNRPASRCVIHTHSMYAQLSTLLNQDQDQYNEINDDEGNDNETEVEVERIDCLRITHLEMIKGVGNHAYDSMLEIPIIDNQRSENLLAPDFEKAISQYPKCNAVLVRRHGVYVWGDSWEDAKTKLESFDYLFQSAVQMKSMGIDCGAIPSASGTKNSNGKRKRMKN